MRSNRWLRAGVVLVIAAAAGSAVAWHAPGHDLATRAALGGPAEGQLPDFLVRGADLAAHCSVDPDTFTRPICGEPLNSAEAPEHYFDLEAVARVVSSPEARDFASTPTRLPPTRYEFLEMVFAHGLKPAQVGLLPYAVAEWTQRLTIALAEYRRWPNDPAIQAKCRVYAGLLAHYAEDLCQPLHTTIHFDGRVGPDGKSPRSGIHLKVDALLGKLSAEEAKTATAGLQPVAFNDTFLAAQAEIARSHALVDRVYELEKDLPAYAEPLAAGSPADQFARERLRAAAQFTASLYLTAWRDSAKVTLPEWHHRPPQPPSSPAPQGSPSLGSTSQPD